MPAKISKLSPGLKYARSVANKTVLQLCTESERYEQAVALSMGGADPNNAEPVARTPVYLAASKTQNLGQESMARQLISHAPTVDEYKLQQYALAAVEHARDLWGNLHQRLEDVEGVFEECAVHNTFNAHGFALRRAALRIAQQPTRQLSTIRPTARASPFQPQIISSCRSFHQTLRWAVDEQKTPAEEAAASPAEAESASETVMTEPSATEQAEIKEESIATPEVADAAKDNSTPVQGTVSEIVSEGKSQAESAFATAQEVVSSAAQTVQRAATGRDSHDSREPRPSGRQRTPDNPPSRILYVGNLFFEVSTPALEAEFGRFGEIVNSRVVTDARGMSKGFGYVEFTSQAEADAAVAELDQKVFQGRRMAVQYHVKREPRGMNSDRATRTTRAPASPSKTLFIGNMSYQMSDRDLNDLFREIRNVLDVRVAIDRRSGQPRGFAHADFVDIDSAQKAKELLEKKVVYGRQLRVDFSAASSSSRSSDSAAQD